MAAVIANWIFLLLAAKGILTESPTLTDISGRMRLSTQIFLGGPMLLSSVPRQQRLLTLEIPAQASCLQDAFLDPLTKSEV